MGYLFKEKNSGIRFLFVYEDENKILEWKVDYILYENVNLI